MRGDGVEQLVEDCCLERAQPLLGAEDLRLVLLELRRDEALGADERLLALVVGGHEARGSALVTSM